MFLDRWSTTPAGCRQSSRLASARAPTEVVQMSCSLLCQVWLWNLATWRLKYRSTGAPNPGWDRERASRIEGHNVKATTNLDTRGTVGRGVGEEVKRDTTNSVLEMSWLHLIFSQYRNACQNPDISRRSTAWSMAHVPDPAVNTGLGLLAVRNV
jgi:hypothetical protein